MVNPTLLVNSLANNGKSVLSKGIYYYRERIYHYWLMNLPVVEYYKGFTINHPIIILKIFKIFTV